MHLLLGAIESAAAVVMSVAGTVTVCLVWLFFKRRPLRIEELAELVPVNDLRVTRCACDTFMYRLVWDELSAWSHYSVNGAIETIFIQPRDRFGWLRASFENGRVTEWKLSFKKTKRAATAEERIALESILERIHYGVRKEQNRSIRGAR